MNKMDKKECIELLEQELVQTNKKKEWIEAAIKTINEK